MNIGSNLAKALLRMASTSLVTGIILTGISPMTAQQTSVIEPSAQATNVNRQSSADAELPDSPGTTLARQVSSNRTAFPSSAQGTPKSASLQAQAIEPQVNQQQEQSPTSQSESQPSQVSQPSPQRPVGTAASGVIPASGVAASQPAGVAIAPARQRRVRTIVLRVGAIVGAGVAVGSVVALSQATPSKPPGAR